MDVWPVDQGDSATFKATLRDEDGNPYTGYAGTESIVATVWPGDELPPIDAVASADWLESSDGTIDVAIDGSATTTLVPGQYIVKLEINGSSVFRATLAIGESSSATAGRVAKVTLRHLRKHYRTIDKLLSGPGFADDPTALEARADAWDWFQDLLHRHYRAGSWPSPDTSFSPWVGIGFGLGPYAVPYRDGRRSAELQGWLDAGRLDLTTPVLDAMAFYALAQLLGGMVAVGEKAGGYASLAFMFAAKAEAQASTITAEIDSDGDGTNDVTIRLDVADTLEG